MWRLVALDIVFHLHSIRDFSIKLDKDWSVSCSQDFVVFTLCTSKKIYQSHPTEKKRWGYDAKETMSISGCIREEGKLPLCCLFVQVWRARWTCRNRASLYIDQPSRELTSPAAKITSDKAEPPTAPIHHRSFYGSHLQINTTGKCVWVYVCVKYVMCGR